LVDTTKFEFFANPAQPVSGSVSACQSGSQASLVERRIGLPFCTKHVSPAAVNCIEDPRGTLFPPKSLGLLKISVCGANLTVEPIEVGMHGEMVTLDQRYSRCFA
jgi:hypothetical protein